MNKRFLPFALLVISAFVLFIACEKKKSNGISPDYRENAGTGGNPNTNNPTVTGTNTLTNPATQNSGFVVGGTGWTNPTCGSTNSVTLKGLNGETEVTLTFASTITSGTYAIGSVPGNSVCAMTVLNAPSQPAGILWVGKSGQVSVNTSTASINAFFTSIQCTQASFIYPVVSVSGNLGCSQ